MCIFISVYLIRLFELNKNRKKDSLYRTLLKLVLKKNNFFFKFLYNTIFY